jgi:adenylate cyclase class 2
MTNADHGRFRRNIELKARLHSLDEARRIAKRLADRPVEVQHQTDTYFHCKSGRLKLRQIQGRASELIWYQRSNGRAPRGSDYRLIPIEDGESLIELLAAGLGIRAVVAKRREIYLYQFVRIHLDEVVGLGEFLEFEAVLSDDIDDLQGQAIVNRMTVVFGVVASDLIKRGYGEMILAETN